MTKIICLFNHKGGVSKTTTFNLGWMLAKKGKKVLLADFDPQCNLTGTSGIVDMAALVNSAQAGIFAALKNVQLFQQVSIELGALTWPNGADLDPLWVHEEVGKNKTWSVPV